MPKSARTIKKVSTAKKNAESLPKKKKKNIPQRIVKKKPYFELATAFLSIPVLITVLLLNVTSLKSINNKPTPTPEPVPNQRSFYASPVGTSHNSATPSVAANTSPCKKALGPVTISDPGENDTVTNNPVTITIQYDDSTYCGAAWSYRINGSSWSGYDDRSVALYNLPRGQITFELRVKSIVTTDETTITRHFNYNGTQAVDVPQSNNSSGSAN
jgi:hypothetical protein